MRLDPLPDLLRAPTLAPVLAALPDARIVGGAVRDVLAGVAPGDVDLATALPPAQVAAALQAAGLRALPTGLAHGTITALSGDTHYEITTLRRDVATDGRHATVAFTGDWREDAARRDFTLNALSLARDGTVFDYFGGLEDLRAGRVRFVGEPASRIAEDHLRILRFFRFHARFGRGAPDRAAMRAIRAGRDGLAQLSGERVRQELLAILGLPDPTPAVAAMARAGVLALLLGAGVRLARLVRLMAAGAPADPLLRLAALRPRAETLARRLRLSAAEAARLTALSPPAPPARLAGDALRRVLADIPGEVLTARAWLAEASGRVGDWAGFRARLEDMQRPVFPLRGADARALGVPAGPEIGVLLAAVRRWWRAGGCQADQAACQAELKRRVLASAPRG